MAASGFTEALLVELESNIYNLHVDNRDINMFGPLKESLTEWLTRRARRFLLKRRLVPGRDIGVLFGALKSFSGFISRFESLYLSLNDEESRRSFVRIIAFGILGNEKVKFPLNTQEYWRQRDDLKRLAEAGNTIEATGYRLYLVDLSAVHYPIKLYTALGGPQTVFLLRQYQYVSHGVDIAAKEDDVVIDAGGCWGDTALYFAHEVGAKGKVFTFECIPGNLEVMQQNLHLNPGLQGRISVVPAPLWSKSNLELFFADHGPSSVGHVDPPKKEGEHLGYLTKSLDDFVKKNRLSRVDFIKMDIEGAEVQALHGAEKTIRRFRPKLAISVYHSVNDFVDVFEFIASLGLGYRFYLGHYTIHWHETVLFAVSVGNASVAAAKPAPRLRRKRNS
jgi:FkbM family methyltransferase